MSKIIYQQNVTISRIIFYYFVIILYILFYIYSFYDLIIGNTRYLTIFKIFSLAKMSFLAVSDCVIMNEWDTDGVLQPPGFLQVKAFMTLDKFIVVCAKVAEVPASYGALISLLCPLQVSASGIPLPPSMKPPTRPQAAAPSLPGIIIRSASQQVNEETMIISYPYSHAVYCVHGVYITFYIHCDV